MAPIKNELLRLPDFLIGLMFGSAGQKTTRRHIDVVWLTPISYSARQKLEIAQRSRMRLFAVLESFAETWQICLRYIVIAMKSCGTLGTEKVT